MFTPDLLTHITELTNLHACQYGNNFNDPENEIATVAFIILLSGCCIVPYRELYSEFLPDTRNEL